MSDRTLYSEPYGTNASAVRCHTCGAWEGWACGDAHCAGSHRQRILAALSAAGRTVRRARSPSTIGGFFLDLRDGTLWDAVPGYRGVFVRRDDLTKDENPRDPA